MVTIVGGSGFIGTRLCALLTLKGIDFTIVDKVLGNNFPNKTFIRDVRIETFSNGINLNSSIINLAAEHKDNIEPKSLYYETNVQGAKNICLAATQNNVNKIIFTSSVAIYGFAPLGTNESGLAAPFNEYGRSKWEAEQVYKNWQAEDPQQRVLVIIRPTVVFGEGNRGNVFNLLKQIASGKFLMVGNGENRKSMAYVENLSAFIEYSLNFNAGIHIYNYIDKPDFTMNTLVAHVNKLLGKTTNNKFRLPFSIGLFIGYCFDLVARLTGHKFPISAIRVKKFCANSVYDSAIEATGFIPPVPLMVAIENTVRFEFIENHKNDQVFYSE